MTPQHPAQLSRRAIAAGLMLLCASTVSNAALEVITLRHRPAVELVSTLQPFLDDDGVIRATGNQLIVRTSDENIRELTRLIAELDRPPRRLLITVRQPLASESSADAIGADTANGRIRGLSTTSRDHNNASQRIQVLEGHSAFIATGQVVPRTKRYSRDDTGSAAEFSYQTVTTGFNVTPRLHGDRVTLEIHSHSANLSQHGAGNVNIQQATTTVSGQLGDWFTIGDVAERTTSGRLGTIYSTRERNEHQRRILIQVTEIGE